MSEPLVLGVETAGGEARAHVWTPSPEPARVGEGSAPAPLLALGHGAGGGVQAADLQALRGLRDAGWTVVLVEQPWRVAGRRIAGRPPTLDPPWVAVLADLDAAGLRADAGGRRRPLVVGGRSAGARVACRTAQQVGADAVLCLSFPLHPPGRPEKSRADELAQPVEAGLPVLVVQGERDPFGRPAEVADAVPGVDLVAVPGDHSPRVGAADLRAHVASWTTTWASSGAGAGDGA